MMLLLWSMACLGIDRFEERYAEAFCTYATECEVLDLEGFSTLQDCNQQAGILPDSCDNYDRSKAQQCLDELALLTCPDGQDGVPNACKQVCD